MSPAVHPCRWTAGFVLSAEVAPSLFHRRHHYVGLCGGVHRRRLHQASPPTEAEKARFASMQSFCNRLRRLDRFEVRLGKLAYRGLDAVGHPIFEQKRVDSMLAVDLVLLAAKRSIRKAVLFTGDSDFLPAVWTAKNEGVIVGLWHGTGAMQPHKDLWDAMDERTPVTEALINTMRRP